MDAQNFDMKISLNTRAFNYETRPTVTCKHLPWVGDGSNAEVKRNVNCDLYEKKGKNQRVMLQRSVKRVRTGVVWSVVFFSLWSLCQKVHRG